MKDFSQSGEQKIILDYFGIKPPETAEEIIARREEPDSSAGNFLSIGENDGLTFSNVRALALSGWRGVCVEPAETAFNKLVLNYLDVTAPKFPAPFSGTPQELATMIADDILVEPNARVKCIQAAITDKDGPIDFYSSGTHLKKGDTDLLSTARVEELERWRKSGEVFTKTTVRGITFATLLQETGLKRADFISIDCEGVDLIVLRQIDLTALGTRMVCVEVNRSDEKPFVDHCAAHGLRPIMRNYENLILAVK